MFCVEKLLAEIVPGVLSQVQKLSQNQGQVQSKPPISEIEALFAEFRYFKEGNKLRDSLILRGVYVTSES